MQTSRIWGTLDPFVEGGAVMGRKVANTAFLDALIAADPFDAYHFFLPSARERDTLTATLAGRYPAQAAGQKFKILTRLELPRCLSDTSYSVFHLSDCIVSQARLAALRNVVSRKIFPITAPTHSLSYAGYGREFLAHLWAGTTSRDAVVATSRAGQAVVRRFFESLRHGYALPEGDFVAPGLVRIPLGVDPAAYGRLEGAARQATRQRLRLPSEAVLLLVLGRVSHSSKMDLVPLLRALQRLLVGGLDPSGLCLVVTGWTDEDAATMIDTLTNLSANLGVPLRVVPRPDETDKRDLLATADIFVSLADNPQETFGLTLLEAMASGLPVVASDYDGYRDIVIPGETGLLIPSLGLADTDPWDLLAPLCYDNHMHLLLAQGLAVDVPATARALGALIRDPGRCRTMGQAGRARVEAAFSWTSVIERHVALWEELASRPVGDRETLRHLRHPAAMAYGTLFAGHPTRPLSDAERLVWSPTGQAVYRKRDFPVLYAGLHGMIDMQAVHTLLFLARSPCPGLVLAARLAAACDLDPFMARFHVVWALKQDLLEVEAAS